MQRLLLILLALCILTGTAGAIAVEIQPDRVVNGDQVTIQVHDLPNGTVFSLKLDGEFAASPGGAFSISTSQLSMPFTLDKGTVTANLENTATNTLVVRKGENQAKVGGKSKDGLFSTVQNVSITAGTYDEIAINGTALPDATTVRTSLVLTGVKQGASDATISFRVSGVTVGTLTVSVLANTAKVYGKEIALGPLPTPTPKKSGAGPVVGLLGVVIAGIAFRRR
jgi:hypothetical protein